MKKKSKKKKVGKEKEKPLIVEYIHQRIFDQNKNFFMIIVGATGSGKSYSALRLAESLDPTFNVDRCCFKAKDFMKEINKLITSGEDVRGKVILWDEMGVEHSAREFMTISNRVINYFFQTSRNLNLIIIVTVPLLSFIDSNTRKLSHCIGETTGINRTLKTVSLKVKMQQVNVMTGKEYPKYLRYIEGGKRFRMERLRVAMPSKELREPYEEKKSLFNVALNERIMNLLDREEDKERPKGVLREDSMQPLVWEIAIKGWRTQEDILEELNKRIGKNVDQGQLSRNITSMRKKGFDVKAFKQK
jgi:hypothetical protein